MVVVVVSGMKDSGDSDQGWLCWAVEVGGGGGVVMR
jgi:hypothetical protein